MLHAAFAGGFIIGFDCSRMPKTGAEPAAKQSTAWASAKLTAVRWVSLDKAPLNW